MTDDHPLAWLAAVAPDAGIEHARWLAAVRALVADVDEWIAAQERQKASEGDDTGRTTGN